MNVIDEQKAEEFNQMLMQERLNTGTTWTRNESFDKNGYLPVENLWDPKELFCEVPEKRGQFSYWSKNLEDFNHMENELQVNGSVSRYWYPLYRHIHTGIRLKLEKIIGRKLYNTYYYDRFYFPGQELEKHVDRDACEISVTLHISTNLTGEDAEWPICIKSPDVYEDKQKKVVISNGSNAAISLGPGDGLIYKGCERPHWRDPMPTPSDSKDKEYYYHQIFFHYVLQDGHRSHCAFDMAR